MPLSVESSLELIQKITWSLIIIMLIASGGWGIILRIIFTPLKIKPHSRTFKKIDDYLLDLQLIRLHHGINVVSKNDAELVFQAIYQGVLSRSDFKLLRFAPPIGLKKSKASDTWLSVFIGLSSIALSIGVAYSLYESKYNHAFYSQGEERVLISHAEIYDIQSRHYLLKTDCRKADGDRKQILLSACEYLLTEDNDKKEELKWAIDRNNNATVSLMAMMVITFIFGMLFFSISTQYYQINDKFCEFKSKNPDNSHLSR